MVKFKRGDVIAWNSIVYGVKHYRIVDAWLDSEPKRLLVTPIDDDSGKCFVATADDCELVKAGSDEDALFKRKPMTGTYARDYKRGDKPFLNTGSSGESV